MGSCFVLYLLLIYFSHADTLNDYFWRDYTGTVPEDAFKAGRDVDNTPTYVGLVHLGYSGVFPATIYKREKVVYVCDAEGVKESQNFIQILCAKSAKNLLWIPANKTHFQSLTRNKHLIRGGIQDRNWLNIGRVNYQGQLIIGKILAGRWPIHDAFMSFVHNGGRKFAYSYEVLAFAAKKKNKVKELSKDKKVSKESDEGAVHADVTNTDKKKFRQQQAETNLKRPQVKKEGGEAKNEDELAVENTSEKPDLSNKDDDDQATEADKSAEDTLKKPEVNIEDEQDVEPALESPEVVSKELAAEEHSQEGEEVENTSEKPEISNAPKVEKDEEEVNSRIISDSDENWGTEIEEEEGSTATV